MWRSFQRRRISIAQSSVESAYITRVAASRIHLGRDRLRPRWLSTFAVLFSSYKEHRPDEMECAPKNVSRDDNQDRENSLRMRKDVLYQRLPMAHAEGTVYSPNSPVSSATGNTRSRASVVNCPLSFFALAALSPAVAVAAAIEIEDIAVARRWSPK